MPTRRPLLLRESVVSHLARARRDRPGRAAPRAPREVPRHGRLRLDARLSTLSTGLSPACESRRFAGKTPAVCDESVKRAAPMLPLGDRPRCSASGLSGRSWGSVRSRPTGRSGIRRARPSRSAPAAAGTARPALRRPAARRPAASTTTSGSSATARSRAGPCRRACRSSRRAPSRRPRRGPPARLRRLRGRDPGRAVRGRHGRDLGPRHVRARRGEEGRRAHRSAPRRAARGHVDARSRPTSTAIRRTGCCSGRTARTAPQGPRLRADARDVDRRAAGRRRLGVRAEVGRLSRARRIVDGGVVTLRSRNDNDLTGRFAAVARALGPAVRSPSAVLDGEICALDEDGTLRLRAAAAGLPARSSSSASTYSSATVSRCSTAPTWSAAQALERAPRRLRSTASSSRPRSTTARRSSRRRASTGSRASWRSGPTRRTSPAAARWSGAS